MSSTRAPPSETTPSETAPPYFPTVPNVKTGVIWYCVHLIFYIASVVVFGYSTFYRDIIHHIAGDSSFYYIVDAVVYGVLGYALLAMIAAAGWTVWHASDRKESIYVFINWLSAIVLPAISFHFGSLYSDLSAVAAVSLLSLSVLSFVAVFLPNTGDLGLIDCFLAIDISTVWRIQVRSPHKNRIIQWSLFCIMLFFLGGGRILVPWAVRRYFENGGGNGGGGNDGGGNDGGGNGGGGNDGGGNGGGGNGGRGNGGRGPGNGGRGRGGGGANEPQVEVAVTGEIREASNDGSSETQVHVVVDPGVAEVGKDGGGQTKDSVVAEEGKDGGGEIKVNVVVDPGVAEEDKDGGGQTKESVVAEKSKDGGGQTKDSVMAEKDKDGGGQTKVDVVVDPVAEEGKDGGGENKVNVVVEPEVNNAGGQIQPTGKGSKKEAGPSPPRRIQPGRKCKKRSSSSSSSSTS